MPRLRHSARERWFVAHVDGAGMTQEERVDLTASRWWTQGELAASTEDLVPRELAARVDVLITHGPPPAPIIIDA